MFAVKRSPKIIGRKKVLIISIIDIKGPTKKISPVGVW